VKKPIRPLAGVNVVVCLNEEKGGKNFKENPKKGLTGPTLLSRWEKRGRGGTKDVMAKLLNGIQQVEVLHGQSEQAGR